MIASTDIADGNRPLVRTRIAPSPTGFLHLGTARTALYSWAYARHHGGQFVLRIEDTDVARSTQDSVDQILASMDWLGLAYDEGPIFQMQRLVRYRQVAEKMIADGLAYRCYSTPEELNATREAKRAAGEKPLYDNRWRPETGKPLPVIPDGVLPVIRFRNPVDGDVTWNDLVKGPITINNREIDDLIIVRTDGVPTYNFAVVVDDWDMGITHVFRGDEHINNTPWQINLFAALKAPMPLFGHCPVILGDDGQKLSKRRGAVSVTAYEDNGYLPEAMLNYLARLGWSHGDEELFTQDQLVQWFDGSHLSKSPAQWDPAKLLWVNAQYIKMADDTRLAALVASQLVKRNVNTSIESLQAICGLFKDRCETTVDLANWATRLISRNARDEQGHQDAAKHLTKDALPRVAALARALASCDWSRDGVAAAIKSVVADLGIKMPELAMPARVLLCGRAQTPSLDALIVVIGRDESITRLQSL